jgi:hypothetical protein
VTGGSDLRVQIFFAPKLGENELPLASHELPQQAGFKELVIRPFEAAEVNARLIVWVTRLIGVREEVAGGKSIWQERGLAA